jgi:hypothetical protein
MITNGGLSVTIIVLFLFHIIDCCSIFVPYCELVFHLCSIFWICVPLLFHVMDSCFMCVPFYGFLLHLCSILYGFLFRFCSIHVPYMQIYTHIYIYKYIYMYIYIYTNVFRIDISYARAGPKCRRHADCATHTGLSVLLTCLLACLLACCLSYSYCLTG